MNINSTQNPSRTSYLFNKVGLFDEYIAYKQDDNTDAILVGDFKDNVFTGTKYTVTTQRSGTQTYYVTGSQALTNETVNISNEYYVYSNIGYGQQAQLYQHQQIQSGATVILLGIIIGYMIIKGAGGIWQWLRTGGR